MGRACVCVFARARSFDEPRRGLEPRRCLPSITNRAALQWRVNKRAPLPRGSFAGFSFSLVPVRVYGPGSLRLVVPRPNKQNGS